MLFGGHVSIRRLLREEPGMVLGILSIAVILLVTVFAPLPHDPLEVNPYNTLQPPSADHWFGTEQNGADVFSRVIAAARLDVPLAMLGAAAAAIDRKSVV